MAGGRFSSPYSVNFANTETPISRFIQSSPAAQTTLRESASAGEVLVSGRSASFADGAGEGEPVELLAARHYAIPMAGIRATETKQGAYL
jgi:hypothetical protein